MVVKEEIVKFCQTTSIKGIPRVVKADQQGFRVSWAFLVILLLTMATYMLYLLVIEYVAYPTYTLTQEKLFDGETDKPIVPTMTLCNEYPFSSLNSNSSILNSSGIEEYFRLVDQHTECPHDCSPEQVYRSKLMRAILKTPSAYFQNLEIHKSQLLGHKESNFILSCEELLFAGLTNVERKCTDLVKITMVSSIDYFNCYRVSLSNNYSMADRGLVAGVQLVLYLDNIVFQRSQDTTPKQEPYVYNYGIVATPHHENGEAFPALDGLHISPGTYTRIQLTMVKSSRMEAPYGHCKQSDIQTYELLKICYADCMQSNIKKNCHCTDSRLVIHKESLSQPYCLKVNHSNSQQTTYNFNCATKHLQLREIVWCRDSCFLPCKEYHYRIETSMSKWPNPTSMKAFYQSYIAGRQYEVYFEDVQSAINGNCTTHTDCRLKFMLAQNLLEQNFIKLKFHISDLR